MPSDYKKITQENIRRRGTDFDDIGKFLSQTLYSDRSHFIFELLQNAEDALNRRSRLLPGQSYPWKVTFTLFGDRLEFRHYGHPFDENDVKGISDVLKGTKANDSNQIGKFGIGFKAVYSFTATPKVHSGDEHFVIERYIRPREISELEHYDLNETVFVFPFDHHDISPQEAFSLIKDRLQSLGSTVLLFLKHIDEIEWLIPETNERGQYLKEQTSQSGGIRHVTLIGQNDKAEDDEEWLVFERTVEVPEKFQNITTGGECVEIAFRYAKDDEGQRKIASLSNSPLVVFFPTEKETQFGFLMQGPYKTTPARDNIPNHDKWNQHLISETAKLIKEALPRLRDMGQLDIELLDGLTTREESFPEDSLFRPLTQDIARLFEEDALLPANDGTFVKAENALLGRGADFRALIGRDQLAHLYNNQEIKWLSGNITIDRTPELRRYLLEVLDIDEVDPPEFVRKIDGTFFEGQADDWMIAFYSFLRNQNTLWKAKTSLYDLSGPLRLKPFIRLQNGEHICPFRSSGLPNAYRASQGISESLLPLVKTSISNDEAANEFLKALGIPEIDIVAEVIEHILPKYKNADVFISQEEHLKDMVKISKAYTTDSQDRKNQLIKTLKLSKIILSTNAATEQTDYKTPADVYIPNPILLSYFWGNESIWFVEVKYYSSSLSMLKEIGAKETIPIVRNNILWDGHVNIRGGRGNHERGLDKFDPDIYVHGLGHALDYITFETAQYIWNNIAIPNLACICGEVEYSTRQTFEYSEKRFKVSSFGELLRTKAWLPDINGNFHPPSELLLADLPDGFIHETILAEKLNMKSDAIAQLAQEIGIKISDVEFIKEHEEEYGKWKLEVLSKKERPSFPIRSSVNPERREERLGEHLDDSPEKEYEQRSRSVRITNNQVEPHSFLKRLYTNDDDIMVCQICKEQMPFKKRNGDFYFEAVEMLSQDFFKKEHEAQYLALCPLCAARYNEFVKSNEDSMTALYQAFIETESEESEIELQLGDLDTAIRFVETHFLDIRTILLMDE